MNFPQKHMHHCAAAGQFGTRLQGGKDASSPRYIFTRLAAPTRHLFNEADDPLLHYLNEEGQDIEPLWCAHTQQRKAKEAALVCSNNERLRLESLASDTATHSCMTP